MADSKTSCVLTTQYLCVVETIDELVVELTLLLMANGLGDGAPRYRVEVGCMTKRHQGELSGYLSRASEIVTPSKTLYGGKVPPLSVQHRPRSEAPFKMIMLKHEREATIKQRLSQIGLMLSIRARAGSKMSNFLSNTFTIFEFGPQDGWMAGWLDGLNDFDIAMLNLAAECGADAFTVSWTRSHHHQF